jgi:hypothetical protein
MNMLEYSLKLIVTIAGLMVLSQFMTRFVRQFGKELIDYYLLRKTETLRELEAELGGGGATH